MTHFPFHHDKRRTQRYPVLEPRDAGELRLGDNRFPVLILDESAGGFAVAAENPSGIIQGEVGLLRAGKDWYEVRVVKVMPLPPLENAPPPNLEAIPLDAAAAYAPPRKSKFRVAFRKKAQYRIGLLRLRDVPNPDIKTKEILWILLGLRLWEHCPGNGILKFLGLLFFVLSVGTVAASLLIGRGRNATVPASGENGGQNSFRLFSDAETPDSQNEKQSLSLRQKIREVLRHARGALAFLEPEVSDELHLTEPQRQTIRTIAEETQKKLEDLRSAATPSGPPDQYTRYEKQILSQARAKALGTLTDRQQDRWHALSGEDAGKEK